MENKESQHSQEIKGKATPALTRLENLLQTPVLPINFGLFQTNKGNLEKLIADIPGGELFGILVTTQEQHNIILKTWSLIYAFLHVKKLQRKITHLSGPVLGCYGVYPQIQNPVAAYQLDSQAEKYADMYILPPNTGGLSGFLRRMITAITKHHLSTAGVVLILRKSQ
jgi:hypothetical protein